MPDMSLDILATTSYGVVALRKLAPVPENFRLYYAGWVEEHPDDWRTMKVKGAVYRAAKSGPNKGVLSIKIKGSQRSACVTREEIDAEMAKAMEIDPHLRALAATLFPHR